METKSKQDALLSNILFKLFSQFPNKTSQISHSKSHLPSVLQECQEKKRIERKKKGIFIQKRKPDKQNAAQNPIFPPQNTKTIAFRTPHCDLFLFARRNRDLAQIRQSSSNPIARRFANNGTEILRSSSLTSTTGPNSRVRLSPSDRGFFLLALFLLL